MLKKKIALFTLIAFALVTLFAGIALAQTGERQSPDKQNQSGPPVLWQTFLGKLAANLGVDQERLQEAIRQTTQQMVDEAAQQGKITPEQAEKIKARLQNGPGFFGFIRKGWPEAGEGRKGWRAKGKNLELLAQILGLSADELKAQLKEGKKISDIAGQQGMSMDQLRQKMQEARIQAVQQAVKDGKLTQEKAEQLIQKIQNGGGKVR
ncbi:MAG: Fis family transcriptional regulator [Bacillota bacterium]